MDMDFTANIKKANILNFAKSLSDMIKIRPKPDVEALSDTFFGIKSEM